MDKAKQQKFAADFQAMHHTDDLLVLPNAWNAGSARVFEKQGFKAVATTSAGIAYSMGCADGEIIKFEDLLYLTKMISSKVQIPLSVDLELGYGNSICEITENVKALIAAGAVGLNIEDGYPGEEDYLEELSFQVNKIKALAELKKELDIDFVINARTCACWLNITDNGDNLDIAIERCNAFADAGADCVFVPGLLDEEQVKRLANEVDAPVNIVANPMFNDFDKIQQAGIKRLSIGSGAVRAVYAKLIDIASELYENNSLKSMLSHNFTYTEANDFFKS